MMSISSITSFIGNLTSFGLMTSPARTFWTIFITAAVNEDFTGLPYVAILLNCVMWVIYESPAVHPNNTLVLIINIIGIVLQVLYLVIAVVYARRRMRITILIMVAVEVVFISVLVAWAFAGVHTRNVRLQVVGWACVCSGILMYASTFPTLIEAWRTMNTNNIPILLILAGLANTLIWLTTAIIQKNLYMLVQNGCGLFLVLSQVGVYVLIRICNRSPPTASDD